VRPSFKGKARAQAKIDHGIVGGTVEDLAETYGGRRTSLKSRRRQGWIERLLSESIAGLGRHVALTIPSKLR